MDGLTLLTNRQNYTNMSKEVNRTLRIDKNNHIARICEEVEEHTNNNQTGDLFQKIKLITKSFRPQSLFIRDEEGNTITTKIRVIQ